MSRMIASYLKDFGSEPPAPVAAPAPLTPSIEFDEPMNFAEPVEVVHVDIEAERRQAYDEGHEAATQALTEAHREEMDAVMAAHHAELEELKAKFEEEAVERITHGLQQMALAVGLSVSNEVARTLSPILTESLTVKAIDELATLINASFLEGAVGPVNVTGRRVMFDRLAEKVDPDGKLLAFFEADDIDLSITIGESILVTRMSAWADGLKDVLA